MFLSQAQLYLYDPTVTDRSPWRPATTADFSGNGGQTGNGDPQPSTSYTTVNYSSASALANVPQDLAPANPNRDRITIQNLDSTDVLLVAIGEDAVSGRAYEIDPRGVGVIEEGEANQRISVMSSKTGLWFIAIGRVRN